MLVNEDTFSKLRADAVAAPSSLRGVWVVSLLHLLALKCHAVKHGHPGRIVKDAQDVIQLIQNNRINPDAKTFVNSSKDMEPRNSIKRLKTPAAPADNLDLELPDWSGMDDTSVRITPEAAFRLCEHYPLLARQARPASQNDRPPKCTVEFVL